VVGFYSSESMVIKAQSCSLALVTACSGFKKLPVVAYQTGVLPEQGRPERMETRAGTPGVV
jgi:hypothetical protein